MARPARNNAEYFTHPASFRNDRRVKAIRARLGAAGYGLLMMLLEALTDADYTELSTDELELELLAGDFGVSVTEIHSLLQAAEKIGLFARNEAGNLICPDLNKWLEPVFDKRNRARNAAKPEPKEVSVTETPESVTESTQSKVKESRVKNSKEDNTPATAVVPAPEEVASPVESPSELPAEFRDWEHWARENAPQVLRMKSKLTASELSKLTTDFGLARVREVCEAMQNHSPLLKKYTSANLTIRDWCKRRASDPPRTGTGNLTPVTRASTNILAKSTPSVKL